MNTGRVAKVGDLSDLSPLGGQLGQVSRRASDAEAVGGDAVVREAQSQDTGKGVARGKELNDVRALTRHSGAAVANEVKGFGGNQVMHDTLLSIRAFLPASYRKN